MSLSAALPGPVGGAVALAVLLGEPFAVTPARIGRGALGLLATTAGISALARPHEIATPTPVAEEFEVAHVVR